jgi:hypothetical protein
MRNPDLGEKFQRQENISSRMEGLPLGCVQSAGHSTMPPLALSPESTTRKRARRQ